MLQQVSLGVKEGNDLIIHNNYLYNDKCQMSRLFEAQIPQIVYTI